MKQVKYKETREMSFFQESLETLANRQMEMRDEVVDSILAGKFDDAKTTLDQLQTLSVGIQLCQQTLMRDADLKQAAEQRAKAEEAAKQPAQAAPGSVLELKPKKKGWFGR